MFIVFINIVFGGKIGIKDVNGLWWLIWSAAMIKQGYMLSLPSSSVFRVHVSPI